MNDAAGIVFVVDDDAAVCRSLTRLARSAGYRAESFESARGFLAGADLTCCPACLLLDLELPDVNGLELQRELGAVLPIVFVTGHGDIGRTVDAMRAGATDFLPKPVGDAVLLDAVARALERSAQMFARRRELETIQARVDRLTPREREVMALVVSGRLNKQVADDLGIAEKTIKIHRARVMEKMEAASLADLVRLADKIGIGTTQNARALR
ncbi:MULTISPECIES: response regulator transcription factor [Burkholderia cepacia complex]|uniref:response regulator transcription factor n=1 Tax=Burkholderia cepacia complex TaxID=87882 RepID=UPI000F0907B3|nr:MULTISPECIES: LuxR C-terminal-related transcriptional regulator [Burkholderia cepacia complex]AYQ43555.1 DNA-binding response regulator [Burkholderia lata]